MIASVGPATVTDLPEHRRRSTMDKSEKARFTFLKALIGAAWLDKSMNAELLNVLKTYLRRVTKSSEEVTGLKPYLQRNFREREATEMIEEWLGLVYMSQPWERRVFAEAVCSLSELDTDETDDRFISHLVGLVEPLPALRDFLDRVRVLLKGRGIAAAAEDAAKSDDYDEFVRGRIMAAVRSKMLDLRLGAELSAKEVAYVTSLSALLGRIAHADEDFSREEKVQISNLLKESTNLSHSDIDVVMETIVDDTLRGLDLKSITRTFFNMSTPEQREQLLICLFLVAGADGHTDPAEVAEIERIAVGLNMSHRDILRGKATAMEIVRKRLALL
jgi:uncharacterized tellurite resistance protein B-like protein